MSILRIQSVVKLVGRRLSGYAQPLRFKDKVAVVTGGCQGIGRGCVDVLAEHGGKVIALDITDDIGSKMESNGPGEITYMHCDVTKENEVKKTIEEIAARFINIDCLVNNVGGHPGANPIDNISIDDFRKTIEHNLVSNFTVSKKLIGTKYDLYMYGQAHFDEIGIFYYYDSAVNKLIPM